MMYWLPLLLLAWPMTALVLLGLLHARTLCALWREPVLLHPVVIVESDDWGVGPPADAAMLARIAARLAGIRDGTGQPAVMTLGLVAGHPDGATILASDLQQYHRRSLDEAAFRPIVDAIRDGCAAGVFALQRHGLEHCWPRSLLARAGEDATLRCWLADPRARSEALPSPLQSRWVDAAVLPSLPLPEAEIAAAVAEEAALLRRLFGAAPTVAVPNTFVWTDAVERAWSATGVSCIVTPGRRLEGRDAAGGLLPPTRRIRNGERTASGALQVVRDDYFEPVRGHRAEQVWQAVAAKTRLGRPTLLETHRESFIAAPATSAAALDELERALRGVLQRWPDTRFMNTAELARHLADPASPLRGQRFSDRLAPVLRRVGHEPALRRLLKFGGWKLVLELAVAVLDGVTHGRAEPRTK